MEYDDVSIVADVYEQLIGPICKVKVLAEVNCLDLEYATTKALPKRRQLCTNRHGVPSHRHSAVLSIARPPVSSAQSKDRKVLAAPS